MPKNKSAQSGPLKSIMLRRDGKGALKFNGERIGSARRSNTINVADYGQAEDWTTYEVSARLFKTSGGKYVLGIEVYNKTDEEYSTRWGQASDSLDDLAKQAKSEVSNWADDDLLGELYEYTEIADQFIVHIE
jgi:hypothetical protein